MFDITAIYHDSITCKFYVRKHVTSIVSHSSLKIKPKSYKIVVKGLRLPCLTVSSCLSDLRNMKLSSDTMGVLKIVLFIFEAVLLTDCARGELH